MKFYKFAIVVVILLSLCGCPDPAVDHSLLPIDSKIKISMREESELGGKHLIFNAQTDKIYGCSNYVIIHDTNFNDHPFEIKYYGIFEPEICLRALGPASIEHDLGVLSNKKYLIEFEFVYSDFYTVELIVTDSLYTIYIQDTTRLYFEDTTLVR